MSIPTPPRRLVLLTCLATALGFLSGLAAWVLVQLIGLITNLALYQRWGWELPPLDTLDTGPQIIIAAVVGALLISLLAKWTPIIRGHGIPEAMEAILTRQSRIAPRTALAKPLSAAIAIGTGAPFGAEGPIIVTGGSLGSLLGQIVRVSPAERKILLASGAAAGMAATFGAPLASVVLAIELLLFEFSTRAFVPLVVASSIAGGMHALFFDAGPFFAVPQHHYAGLPVLPLFALLGVGAGLLAVLINTGLFTIEGWYRRLPVSEFWHPVIGAVAFGAIGLAVPQALGVGYDVIGELLTDRLAAGTVIVVVLAKLFAWWFALGSGTSGGTLAPILLISAGFGNLFGGALESILPGSTVSAGAFAVVAMAATFGASTRATFASIVFVFELTRDFSVILPLMLASVVADLVAATLMRDSIMTEKLSRRGLRVQAEYQVDLFRTVAASEIMSSPVATLPASATVADARARIAAGGHGAYPIVDDGRLVGIVTRGDLLREQADDADPVLEHGSRDVVTVRPDDTAVTVLQRMLEEAIEHVPVVDGDRLVGICTRTDLMEIRRRQFEQERHEPGWMPPWVRRAPEVNGRFGADDRVLPPPVG